MWNYHKWNLTVSWPIELLFEVVEPVVDEKREPARQKAILFCWKEINWSFGWFFEQKIKVSIYLQLNICMHSCVLVNQWIVYSTVRNNDR